MDYRPGVLTLLLAAFALAGALNGWILVRLLHQHVDEAWLARCASTILPDETVVMAEIEASETARVLVILRDVETEAPVTFAFHSPPPFSAESTTRRLREERPSIQRLSENAAHLAGSILISRDAQPRGQSFLRRLREVESALEWTNASLTMSAEVHHAFALSAEWLLDNAYLIQGAGQRFPAESPGKLLRRAAGHRQRSRGRTAARLPGRVGNRSRERWRIGCRRSIRNFLVAFQAVSPLNIGELWAVPLMLRLRLIECLRSLAIQVEQLQRESEQADFWANRLITGVRRSPDAVARG